MTFLAHAAAHGLLIQDLISDGRWHRCRTEDKPRKRNGSYLFDGEHGVVINWATMPKASVWREGGRTEQVDRAAIRAMQAAHRAEEARRQVEARSVAEGMVRRAVVDKHAYLAAKGFPDETGLVLEGELLVPMREFSLYKQINSVQRIAADGSKLFLTGGKAKGSVFFIGPYLARERWLCEGYATGLSLRMALRAMYRDAQVVVCFSAGNLAHIGQIVKGLKPQAYAMADNDESGAGARAAEETGLPWCMPHEVGQDANDVHQRLGIRALSGLIRDMRGERQAVG